MIGIKKMDCLKCNICFNTYNEFSLRPRSLNCGHTFCEGCLTNTIQKESLICPQCRKMYEINSVLDLPINFTLEEILKSINTCSLEESAGVKQNSIKGESNIDDISKSDGSLKSFIDQQKKIVAARNELTTSAGFCNDHPSMECMFRCSLHKCWVCEQCVEDEGDHPKIQCKIISFKEEVKQRSQDHIKPLEDEGKSCDETLSLLEKHISYLKFERKRHDTLFHSLQNLAATHKTEEQKLENEICSCQKNIERGENVKKKLQDFKESVLNAATLDESNAARDMVKNKKADARNWINTSQKDVMQGKLKNEESTSAVSTENCLEYREQIMLLKLINNDDLDYPESNVTTGKECSNKITVTYGGFAYSCLQCRTDDSIILCGSCFVNSVHVNHTHEIRSCTRWYCDCGMSEAWKSNPTCITHSKKVDLPLQPYNASEYSSSKCKKLFFRGEKCFSCLGCRTCKNMILCGHCFVNSSHRFHTYEICTIKGDGAFCDCGRKESWKKDYSCDFHNSIDE